jgi:hypothetical protein
LIRKGHSLWFSKGSSFGRVPKNTSQGAKKRCHTSLVYGVIGLREDVVTVYGKEYIMSTESLSSITDNQSAVICSYLLQIKH